MTNIVVAIDATEHSLNRLALAKLLGLGDEGAAGRRPCL